MPIFSARSIRKQLGLVNSRALYLLAGIIGGLIVVAIFSMIITKSRTSQTASNQPIESVGLDKLPYWEESNENVLFEWQPVDQETAIQISGTRRAGNKASSQETNPGFELVNEGYRSVELNQGKLSPISGISGYQKESEVCVLKTILSAGHEGLLQDNPDVDYELLCGTLPQ